MPEIIQVSDIAKYDGQEVTVQGWVYNRTDKGKLVFLLVRDGSGFVQCVAFKGDLDEAVFDRLVPCHRNRRWSSLAPFVQISARPASPADMKSV